MDVRGAGVQVIGNHRATRAALSPLGPEHEVVDEKLRLIAEQIRQRVRAAGGFEAVRLLDLHPRKLPAKLGQLIVQMRALLFLRDQLFPSGQPLLGANDGVRPFGCFQYG